MPFTIRPSRRFLPVQCPVSYNSGPFLGRWKHRGLKTGMEPSMQRPRRLYCWPAEQSKWKCLLTVSPSLFQTTPPHQLGLLTIGNAAHAKQDPLFR